MKTIHFEIEISADRRKIWKFMLEPESFKEWTSAFAPDTYYKGEYKEGAEIRFMNPASGGTKAKVNEVKEPDRVSVKHAAIILPDGTEDTESEVATKWIGTIESYTLHKKTDDNTLVRIDIETDEFFEQMFRAGWPASLAKLKQLCEQ